MTDIRDRLAKATTEEGEREALLAAVNVVWPIIEGTATLRPDGGYEAELLLEGPRAGWIGVPILAMPGLWTCCAEDGPAHARVLPATKNGDFVGSKYVTADAELPSCALMLAVLAAREVKQ